MNIQNQTLIEQKIDISDRQRFNMIGGGSHLIRCDLTCNVDASSLSLTGSVLEECCFTVRKELVGFSWLETQLVRTRFLGCYRENEFGFQNDVPDQGTTEACDFSQACLDDCTFFGCDLGQIKFPKWPHFVVEMPAKYGSRMEDATDDEDIKMLCETFSMSDPDVVAVVNCATSVAKELGLKVNTLKDFLTEFKFVHL